MKKQSRRPSIIIYALVFLAIILLISGLFSDEDYPTLTYGQMQQQFLDENVKSFVWEDGILTLELYRPTENGDTKVQHELADVYMFQEDFSELYLQQSADGIIRSFNFVPVEATPWYLSMLPYLILMIIMIVAMYILSARAGGGNGAVKFGKAAFRVGNGPKKVTFEDVAGADEEKAELQEIVDFLRNPDKYRRIGAKIPKGVLLVGPPGTGKTLLAKAVAGEAGVQFLSISGSDFVELYVGIGASRVRDLFDQAKKVAPSIIFIDEIDAVGRKRGAGLGGGHDEREQTLNQLLVEMDGFAANEGVIVIAATNRHDILDPALLRPGRFDRQIYVSTPDAKGRVEILRVHARDKLLAEDVDLQTIANATKGFTGADLENLLNEAALLSARANCPVITMHHLEEAMIKVIAGPEKHSRVQRKQDLRITAYHEAGHAVAMHYLPTHDPVHRISILPRGGSLGMTISIPDEDASHWTRNQMRERIVGLLGGRVAEQLEFDDVSTGASNDLQRASSIAHDMVAKYGMSDRLGAVSYDNDDEIFVGMNYERTRSYSERVAGEIDEERKLIIDTAYAKCEAILKEHYDQLRAVAEYLLEHENMSRAQFLACMNGEPIPDCAESLFDGTEPPHDGQQSVENAPRKQEDCPDGENPTE